MLCDAGCVFIVQKGNVSFRACCSQNATSQSDENDVKSRMTDLSS